MPLPPLQTSCSKPLYKMMVDDTFNWLPCPYAEQGAGVLGVGMLVWFAVFVIMANWSEGFKLPIAWTALFATVIFPFLPGVVAWRLLNIAVIGVIVTIFLVWRYWGTA